jgi:hypothetical protein
MYAERPVTGDTAGQIRFSNIRACMKPFSNMKSAKGTIPDFNLTASATIMDSCEMKANLKYLMSNPNNLFQVDGTLGPFDMRILNPVLEPLAMVSIRSGKVDQFTFNFSADKTSSSGQLYFGYDDLKISVLEMKDGNTKEAKFASFLANSLMLRSKNPRGKELLPDEINFRRDQKRSTLNYWWKSIFSGIRNTLGLKDKQEDQEKSEQKQTNP